MVVLRRMVRDTMLQPLQRRIVPTAGDTSHDPELPPMAGNVAGGYCLLRPHPFPYLELQRNSKSGG